MTTAKTPTDSGIHHIYCSDMSVRYVEDPKQTVSNHISFEVKRGEILAIMGPSGAGKSTLLKGLLGRAPFVTGEIRVNGKDQSGVGGLASMSHRVGLVPQRDVLVDELSMVENIRFFHKIAVDTSYTDVELEERITRSLACLGLVDEPEKNIKDRLTRKRIGDGSGVKSEISGGQAKRANIAMELVNDPDVLIIDEPTSGLSSHDSLELLEQLRLIADSGKIVIVIIHQPSSAIFQKFDRLLMLDGHGNGVRSGPRKDVVRWFESRALVGGHFGCASCGNDFPDLLLATIEVKKNALDGKSDWPTEAKAFAEQFPAYASAEPDSVVKGKSVLRPWQALLDIKALLHRHWLVKIRDRMSLVTTFVAPPLLGALFASVFRAAPEGANYAFASNALFAQLLFMLIVCTMFLGLVNSVVEVIKDRPILEREAARGLRMWAYYSTKYFALMFFGVIQVLLLSVVAFTLIDAPHLIVTNLALLLLVMAFSVAFGLLLSSVCDTATKAFNLVPLLLLPQIVLGGALLPYRDMGASLYLWEARDESRQPIVAKLMPASWAYELGMRMNFEAEREHAHTGINVALSSLQQIKAGGFLALQPQRSLRAEPFAFAGMGTPTLWTRLRGQNYGADALVLLLFTVSALVMGWAWAGAAYRSGQRPRRLAWTTSWGSAIVCVTAFSGLTDPLGAPGPMAGATAAAPAGYIVAPAPMPWPQAVRYCREHGSQVADLEITLAAYRANARVMGRDSYWTLERAPNAHAAAAPTMSPVARGAKHPATPDAATALHPGELVLAKLAGHSPSVLTSVFVRTLPKAYASSANPKMSKRFVCR